MPSTSFVWAVLVCTLNAALLSINAINANTNDSGMEAKPVFDTVINDTLSNADQKAHFDDTFPLKEDSDPETTITTAIITAIKKPIYETRAFIVLVGIVFAYWLLTTIAIALIIFFCFMRKRSKEKHNEEDDDGESEEGETQKTDMKSKKSSKNEGKSKKKKGMKDDDESSEGDDDEEKSVVKKEKRDKKEKKKKKSKSNE